MEWQTVQFYASHLGWPLFPCSNRNKSPLTPHGFKDASCDLAQLEQWHQQYPGCAWATPTSAERGVIDIDPRNGGNESLAKLLAQHGPLPTTPTVRTGGGGWHYWLRFPEGTSCGKIAPGIDRKASGGYVVIPPSRIDCPEHQGRAYAWEVRPWELAIADAPPWCYGSRPTQSQPASNAASNAAADANDPWVVRPALPDLLTHPGSPEGERRRTLCQLVGVHLARGDSEASVRAMAEVWASRCNPPLPEWEKHVDGLMRREMEKGLKMTTTFTSPPCRVSVSIEEELGDTLVPEGRKEGSTCQGVSDGQATDILPSFPPFAEGGEQSGLSADWPSLSPDAYHGLLGSMLKAIEPHTEADPAGILLGWLTCLGSCVGRKAWTYACDEHHPALYVAIVGLTSARKGVAYGISRWPFAQVDPVWAKRAVCNGVGSGQGLIERVRDEGPLTLDKKTGEAKAIPAAEEKRCLLRLDELSVCFKQQRQDSSILGDLLMTAWAGGLLSLPNRADNALSASDYAISLIGDTQPGTLAKLLASGKGTETVSGWMNRFLWVHVRRQRNIPRPAKLAPLLSPYLDRLASALASAKQAGEVMWDADADRLWEGVYDELSVSADSVPHTNRAEGYAARLALLYALADESRTIRQEHLQAALAVWDYCRASARRLFGQDSDSGQGPTHDPLPVRVLNAISRCPGISRSDLLREFRELSAEVLDGILVWAERSELAYRRMVRTGGRSVERWYPGPPPDGDGDGERDRDGDGERDRDGDEDDNHLTAIPDGPAVASASAESEGRKEGRSALVADGQGDGKEGRKEESLSADTDLLPSFPKPEASAQGPNHGQGQGEEEVVTSFLPLAEATVEAQGQDQDQDQDQDQGGEQQGEERQAVVSREPIPDPEPSPDPSGQQPSPEQAHFSHEASGGLSMGSGEPDRPSPTEPFGFLQPGSQTELAFAHYKADKPPATAEEVERWAERVDAQWRAMAAEVGMDWDKMLEGE